MASLLSAHWCDWAILLDYWLGMDSGCLVAVIPLLSGYSIAVESVCVLSILFGNVENSCKLLIGDG